MIRNGTFGLAFLFATAWLTNWSLGQPPNLIVVAEPLDLSNSAPVVAAALPEAPVESASNAAARKSVSNAPDAVHVRILDAPEPAIPATEANIADAEAVEIVSSSGPTLAPPTVKMRLVEIRAAEAPATEISPAQEAPTEAATAEAAAPAAPLLASDVVETPSGETPTGEAPALESVATTSPTTEAPAQETAAVETLGVDPLVAEAAAPETKAIASLATLNVSSQPQMLQPAPEIKRIPATPEPSQPKRRRTLSDYDGGESARNVHPVGLSPLAGQDSTATFVPSLPASSGRTLDSGSPGARVASNPSPQPRQWATPAMPRVVPNGRVTPPAARFARPAQVRPSPSHRAPESFRPPMSPRQGPINAAYPPPNSWGNNGVSSGLAPIAHRAPEARRTFVATPAPMVPAASRPWGVQVR